MYTSSTQPARQAHRRAPSGGSGPARSEGHAATACIIHARFRMESPLLPTRPSSGQRHGVAGARPPLMRCQSTRVWLHFSARQGASTCAKLAQRDRPSGLQSTLSL